jgi:hypothetical protein
VVTAPASHQDNQPEPTNVEPTDVVAPTDAVTDGKIGLDDFFTEAGTVPPLSNKSRRIAVAYVFQAVHGGQEDCPNKPWNGEGRILPQIKKALDIAPTTDITYILDEFLNCKKFGMVYDGSRQVTRKLGRDR